jgi:iron complex outermembrane receptor protein
MKRIRGASLAAIALGLSGAAYAQEQPGGPQAADPAGAAAGARGSADAPAAAAAAPSNSNALEDIVVTAQFRRERLQDTPLAITAVTGDMMTARSQSSITDVATRAPSVTLTTAGANGGGAQSFQASIRGIGQADFNLALEPGVGTYVDDVYYGVMIGTTFELLDLDRIEVLRGPQGTLSGKNSEGGAIKLFSKLPNNDAGGFIAGSYGSYDRMEIRGSVNFPIVPDKLFLRLSGLGREVDGYLTRLDYQCATGKTPTPINYAASQVTSGSSCKLGTEGGQSVVALRGALRWIASETIENTLFVDVTRDKSEPTPNVLIRQGVWHGTGYDLLAVPPVPNIAQDFTTGGTYRNYATYTSLSGLPSQYTVPAISNVKQWGVSDTLTVNLADTLSLTSITAYRHANQQSNTDGDASPVNRLAQFIQFRHRQFTEELRLNGEIGEIVDWTLGGFYYDAKSDQAGRVAIDGAGDSPINGVPFFVPFDFTYFEPIKVKSKSGFAQAVFHPIEGLDLSGGLRYTDDRKDFAYQRALVPGTPPSFLSDSVLPLNGQSRTFKGSRWDWRVAAAYRLNEQLNVYGQVATGFKGGGVNPRPFYPTQIFSFGPEKVTAYEIGFKSDLFDRHMRFNVAAFINKFKDMQLTLTKCDAFVPAGLPANCYLPANVGDSTIKGIEVETEIRPVAGLLIDGSMSYTYFKYDQVDPAVVGLLLSYKAPYTPKWKASVGAQYAVDLGGIGTLTPRLDYIYQSSLYTEVLNDPLNRLAGYGIANARLTYRETAGNWELSLAVTNLTDNYYYANYFDRLSNNNGFKLLAGQPGRPREWSLTLRRNF